MGDRGDISPFRGPVRASDFQSPEHRPNFYPRYDLVDHIFVQRLSPARVMETRNRRKLVAFVGEEAYVRVPGDPEDSD